MPEGSTSIHTGSKGGVLPRAVVEGWCPVSCKVASVCRSKGNSKVCPHRNRRVGSLRDTLGVKVPENVLNSTIAPVGSEGNAVKGNHEGAVPGVMQASPCNDLTHSDACSGAC